MAGSATLARRASRHLRSADPVLARLMDRVGPYRPVHREGGTHFEALVRSIVFQQLSGKAASTIHARVCALFPGNVPTPDGLLATSAERLREAGLSRQKIAYLRDLAARVQGGELPLDHVDALADDDLIAHLVQVKGIGRWTAHMFLMFRLGRPDVLPELDLGIRNAIKKAYRRRRVTARDVQRIGSRWRPFASVACWYLWRSLELSETAGRKARAS